MFKQIVNSSDPKVIGVNNGIYQIELSDDKMESRKDYQVIESLFLAPSITDLPDHNHKVLNLEIKPLEGQILKKAKETDIMGFSPYFFGCKYIVSEKIVTCLKEANVSDTNYRLIPLVLTNTSISYYIMFVPMISHSEVIFQDSLIFPERDFLKTQKEYFKVESFEDYTKLLDKTAMSSFEKVALPTKYQNRSIISIQGISYLYFSNALIEKMYAKNISSFMVANRQVELTFA